MKEVPLQRMNFMKHGRKGITYKGMLYGLVVWCAFLMLLYGIQMLRYYWVVRDIEVSKELVKALEI